ATAVTVCLTLNGDALTLRIKDNGKGIPAGELRAKLLAHVEGNGSGPLQLGLGLPGMVVRLQQFGGTLELLRSDNGTEVLATIPLLAGSGRQRRTRIDSGIPLPSKA